MEVLDHTNDHQPTRMSDVYETLIGETVHVFAKGCDHSISGKLVAYNGCVLHVLSNSDINYYMSISDVAVIGSDK